MKLNWYSLWPLFGLILLIPQSHAFLRRNLFPSVEPANRLIKDGRLSSFSVNSEALFLTPLIESGKLEEGRRLSQVHLPGNAPQIESYTGFLTVNKTYNSNLFFWFFPPLSGEATAPVVLWLQGGPGGSSLFGLFVENGPFQVTKDLNVIMRNYSWNQNFALLYIDNPVGTGFSFTDNDKGYARDENDVARDLYEGLTQFFTLFQSYRGNEFFVTGESYAGKYVPAISHKIYSMGEKAKNAGINLKGIAIGDGLCDPRNMGDYGQFLYQVGLIDEEQRKHFHDAQVLAENYIDNKQFYKAFQIFDALLNGDLTNGSSYFHNVTGLSFYFNFLYDVAPEAFDYYVTYLGKNEVRDAIHVGDRPYNDGTIVEQHLINDIMDSVKPLVEDLLNADYPVLIYSGQLDIIVAAPLSESFLQKLKWKGSSTYMQAKRNIYKVNPQDKTIAGYVRQADNLYQIIIRNAGHILPFDQPRAAFDMISRFINRTEF